MTKRLILLAVLLLGFTSTGGIVQFNASGGVDCATLEPETYLIEDDFEDGCDAEWDVFGGDYSCAYDVVSPTDLNMRGSYGLRIGDGTPPTETWGRAGITGDATGSASLEVAFLFHVTQHSGAAASYIMSFYGQDDSQDCFLLWNYDAGANFTVSPTGGDSVGTGAVYDADTTYKVKVKYTAATGGGGNAVCEVWIAAEDETTSWGTVAAQSTNGTQTSLPDQFELDMRGASYLNEMIFDNLKASYEDIPVCAID